MSIHPECERWSARAAQVLAGGPATLSKHSSRFPQGIAPLVLEEGAGPYVWCADGHRYIDTIAALGPILLGHNAAGVSEAVRTQAGRLTSASLLTRLECEVAELLCDCIPGAEQARFARNGADVCNAAVKVARYVTGHPQMVFCYSPDTEILTRDRGYVLIGDLRLGEYVATLTKEDNLLEYNPIEKLITKNFSGDMVHVSGKRIDLLVTPEHNVFIGKQVHADEKTSASNTVNIGARYFGDFCFLEAQRLVSMSTTPQYMLSGAHWNGKCVDSIEIPWSGGLFEGSKKVNAKTFVKFLGWFVTEGCLCYSNTQKHVIRLAQNPGRKQNEIVSTIREMGFHPRICGDKIDFVSEDLWLYLQQCGRGAHSKCIPSQWKEFSSDLLQVMVDAMVDGDGTRRENGAAGKFYSVSKILIDDFCEIALKSGYSTTVSKITRNGFSLGEIYHVSISRNIIREIHAKNIRQVAYDGIVYCLTVKNHIVMTRRHGKAVWSGNCGYHGMTDSYLSTTDKAGGLLPQIRQYNHQVQWGDMESLTHVCEETMTRQGRTVGELAAIMLEVPPEPQGVMREQTAAMIQFYADEAHTRGALFILDNVVTGLRYGLGGALSYYGVEADLVCHSKALGNGHAISALTGPRELMRVFEGGTVFLSSTFGGEAIGLAAAQAVLTILRETDALLQLQIHGQTVLDSLVTLFTKYALPVRVRGNYARIVCDWQEVPGLVTAAELRTLWWQELCKHNVLASVPWFPMACYTDTVVRELVAAMQQACEVLHAVVAEQRPIGDVLECDVIMDVFAQRYAPAS